jgi:hypothetical protein
MHYNLRSAGVAQLVEQHIRNVWVNGSIPFIGSIKSIGYVTNGRAYLKMLQFRCTSKKTSATLAGNQA